MVAAQGLELHPTAGTPALLGLLGKPEIYRGTRGWRWGGGGGGGRVPPPPQEREAAPPPHISNCGSQSCVALTLKRVGGQRALLLCQAMS